ncbi:MAG: chitobiase/beta-hexosaminidase C-terminal domain-containing protein, partial [Opitutaceae bacterium]
MDHRGLKWVALAWLIFVGVPILSLAAEPVSRNPTAPTEFRDAVIDAVPARGFYEEPVTVRLDSSQAGASIRFTTDGTEPTAVRSQAYTAPLRLAHQTVLRAAVFEGGRRISAVATHTYLFLEDVLRQPREQTGLPNGATAWSGYPAAYAMDPRVVQDPAYGPRLKPALRSLPTVSVVCAPQDLFGRRGIYLHSTERGDEWERACSVEWIVPDGAPGFQIDCGLQIQGNFNRIPEKSPKHSFRLMFKERYGPGKLKFPLFPASPVKSFNTLLLRAGYNNTWVHWDAPQYNRAQPNRDGWMKDSFRAMGWLTTHDRYVHLYLNGLYWGLYDISERPDGAFASSYLGGEKADYDVINESEVKEGTGDAFARLQSSRNLGSPARYAAVLPQVEMTRFIDYLLLNYYAGNEDWGENKNWYALRRREPAAPFQFFVWDGEHVFENLDDDAVRRPHEAPLRIARALMASADFRLAFADRVQKHCFNGGALTPESAGARWMVRSNQIDLAIIAESARWGYYRRQAPFTRDGDWVREQRRLLEGYFPKRTGILLRQLRAAGLFPEVSAPVLQNQISGEPAGRPIVFAAPGRGEIYFTTDGSDPRQTGSGKVAPAATRYAETVNLRASDVL